MIDEINTLQSIRDAGMKEFLNKGFHNASQRNIVKDAGVTTGAFYGYFSSKEALFAALVEEHAAAVMACFVKAQENFEKIPKENQAENMVSTTGPCIEEMIDYIYDNYDYFKLLICCADGTAYEDFVHNMVEIEVESTYRFMDVLKEMGRKVPQIDRGLCHILCSGMFGGMFEVIVHDMPKENVKHYVKQLMEFHHAGWEKIMGL